MRCFVSWSIWPLIGISLILTLVCIYIVYLAYHKHRFTYLLSTVLIIVNTTGLIFFPCWMIVLNIFEIIFAVLIYKEKLKILLA
ncbi:MAG: hypothetical protein MAG795_00013 [Candidatus Woesearchaeota archaeon]|nr:hypothetical protein [Candidatus Woesearchaeota archaeon]